MTIGKHIKRLRHDMNITQEQLGDYLGVTAQAVSKWENGITSPDIGLLPDLSVFFGVKIDDLFKLPESAHFERIDMMFIRQREISEEDFKYAQDFLNEALSQDKYRSRALGGLARLYNHKAAYLRDLAGDYAKLALDQAPDLKDNHVALWDAYGGVCGDGYYDNHFEVIAYYKTFVTKHPDNGMALVTLIENLLADKLFEEAKGYIELLMTKRDDYLCHFYLGDIALAEGRRADALKAWDRGVEESSGVWQAYCCRGDRLRQLAQTALALADYDKCMSLQEGPRMTDGLLSMAQIYEEDKNYLKAIECREEEIKIIKEDYNIFEGEILEKPQREIVRLMKYL